MGSKNRIPPHLMRHPIPGPGMVHPEPFGVGVRPPPGRFPLDMLPPPEIMEQKLASQHMEMERLASENQRLAATHGTLRQQLAGAQQELQMLESQFQASKSEREQQMRGLLDRMSKMEAELQSADRLKIDLQQAKTDAHSLVEVRQELISKVRQVNDELQRARVDGQQIPLLMSELNNLRQEFHQCRATYEHERKVYLDHLESLKVMDNEYRSMADEVTRLRAELTTTANIDKRSAYVGGPGYGKGDSSAQNAPTPSAYEASYGAPQAHGSFPASNAAATVPVVAGAGVVASSGSTPTYAAPQTGASRIPSYGAQRGPTYDPQSGQVYNAQRVSGYDSYTQRPPPYDPQRGYEISQTVNYDPNFRGAALAPGQPLVNNMPYGSAPPAPAPGRTGTGNDAQSRGGTAGRR
ncbi:hypothetical protein RND81_10G158500 [Saponaria officinalis]|uniref:Protein FLX-like 2 n=1 Tax=Saponaria officinalis TaxID=3572 RepID=A0AAW1I2T9_SAPOF